MATGSKGYIEVPFGCTVTANRLQADVSGSVVVDVKKATYAGLPTTASICASAKPTLATAQKSEDTTAHRLDHRGRGRRLAGDQRRQRHHDQARDAVAHRSEDLMAVVLVEGFDHLSAAQTLASGKWTGNFVVVVAGRLAGQAARAGNTNLVKALPSTYSTLIVGFAFRVTSTATDTYFNLRGSGANIVRLQLAASGPSQVFKLVNAGGTQLAIGTTPILPNIWYYIELKVVVSATVGTVELRLNGLASAECSGSGLNTGSANIDSVQFVTAVSQSMDVDDVYGVDTSGSSPTNDFLGDRRVETLMPTAEGANTAWTANTGTKAGAVDDPTTHRLGHDLHPRQHAGRPRDVHLRIAGRRDRDHRSGTGQPRRSEG